MTYDSEFFSDDERVLAFFFKQSMGHIYHTLVVPDTDFSCSVLYFILDKLVNIESTAFLCLIIVPFLFNLSFIFYVNCKGCYGKPE